MTTTTNAKPSAVPTAKVFAGYVDELMAAGAAIEKVAAKIALAATRQAAHRSSLTYLNAAYAAFRACHVNCTAQLMRYALGVLGGLTADDNGKHMVSRSKSIIRITDVKERKKDQRWRRFCVGHRTEGRACQGNTFTRASHTRRKRI